LCLAVPAFPIRSKHQVRLSGFISASCETVVDSLVRLLPRPEEQQHFRDFCYRCVPYPMHPACFVVQSFSVSLHAIQSQTEHHAVFRMRMFMHV
jgi:hypothetical protein